MRIVLQNATSGEYVKEPGTWTANLDEALNFGSSLHAMRFMQQQHLPNVQVLVAFVDSAFEDWLTIPAHSDFPFRSTA